MYNGFTNHATWNCNNWILNECWSDYLKEINFEELVEYIENY